MNRLRTSVALLVAVGTLVPAAAAAAPAPPRTSAAVAPADSTRHVQQMLKGFGYSVVVDGIYGPQTTKAVRHFQKANRLLVDGIAGPITIAILEGAEAKAPAVRLNPPAPQPMSVEEIIRDVWPDELENEALRIARRESNWQPEVRNFCCFGLFQIYWNVHRGWLADHGVTSSDQLFDARTNSQMAYLLYQRAGGWGPWAL